LTCLAFALDAGIIMGSVRMLGRPGKQARGEAQLAALLALIPASPAWLLLAPAGIWALVLLERKK
jgi:hypothetical protein